jgi:Zn-finger nucleic acid-binding protein
MTAIQCPKCGSAMTSQERSGVVVEQCTGCRGVFLDRGELEALIDTEGAQDSHQREAFLRELFDYPKP